MSLSRGDHEVRVERPWSLNERSGTLLLMLLVPTILLLDYTAGRDFSLHLFYLVPTGLAAWSFGSRAGYAVGFAAAVYWAFVGFATHHPGASAASLAWDVLSTLALFLFFAFIVARHRAFVDSLVETARIDAASGALSKREFGRLFETEVRRARRYKRPLALAMFAVTDAKHWAGKSTEFLPAVVRAAMGQVRDSDAVGRIAERRLGVVLVECPAAEALRVAARIREGLDAALRLRSGPPAIGLATYGGTDPVIAADLLQIAADQVARAQAGTGFSESGMP